MADNSTVHQVLARYRFRSSYSWELIGRVRYEYDPATGLILASHALLKTLPVGGFDGYVMGLPLDAAPPSRQQPKRPAQLADDAEATQDQELYNSLYGF